jgi:ribonuclease R
MASSNKGSGFWNSIQEDLLSFFELNDFRAYSLNQVYKAFAVRDRKTKEIFSDVTEFLAKEGRLHRSADGSFQYIKQANQVEGKLDHVNQRFAFVLTDEGEQDIWVATEDLNGAQDGDRVRVRLLPQRNKKSPRPEGEVVAIVERANNSIVGTIQITPHYSFVVPDSKKIYQDIYIPKQFTLNAAHLDKVLVEVTSWAKEGKKAEGKVIEVLGQSGNNDTEMHAILLEYGLPYHFPEQVEKSAEKISSLISTEELAKRKDFRNVLTFTIDPKDAKDFDDAISFQTLKNGNVEIGVHIADVSHYVSPGSILDQEAYLRATSVYLVDRVVPMLPEKLSNGLCSLRPNEDKLTFSAVFEMDTNGKIVKEWFGRTVIHSDRRFAYEEAQVYIEEALQPNDTYSPVIKELDRLAKILRAERFRKGSVNFETVEVKFELDENGKPLAVYPRERKDAHKLIEEFMLLANKRVATFVHEMKKTEPRNTMVYRVHESPDPEKLKVFSTFARKFGYTVSTDPLHISDSFNVLMDDIQGKAEEHVLQSLAVRTMSKARYSTDAIGHFGLAFPFYSHFTSPIRRYPDVMTHRLLQHYLDKGQTADRAPLEAQCKHCSDREKLAAEAERASIKYKQVEYMSLHEPQIFEGIISGVTEFGFFVEIGETSCEGLVRMADLNDDFYELDKENYRIVGRSNGRVYNFGDKVRVRVSNTNLSKRTIDLELIGNERSRFNSRSKPTRNQKSSRSSKVIPRGKRRRG